VKPDEQRVRCPKCGVVHHLECWRANGRCSVYGCDGWAVWTSEIADKVAPTPSETVEVPKTPEADSVEQEKFGCIKCGGPVRRSEIICRRCRSALTEKHYLENCFGPSLLLLLGLVGTAVLIARMLV